ncbi:MAG: YqaJ viral recombinase family protein [Methylococcales bacterium]|nr:YqaJ viral recombinase family protein [Methylococcales bacterium]
MITTQLNPSQQESLKTGIGGSTIANILGLGYQTPLDEYNKIVNPETRPDLSNNPHVVAGIYLEPVIRSMAIDVLQLRVRQCNVTKYHPVFPYMRANIDGKLSGVDEGVEFKNRGHFQGNRYGEQLTDEVLDSELAQCLWYLGITGWQRWHLVVLIGGFDLRHFIIERDEQLIADITEKARIFWEQHVEKRIPPLPTTKGDLKNLYPSDDGLAITATADIAIDISALTLLKQTIAETEHAASEIEIRIKNFVGSNSVLTDREGKPLATWKAQKTNRIDTTALKNDLPDIAESYTKVTESRVWRIK